MTDEVGHDYEITEDDAVNEQDETVYGFWNHRVIEKTTEYGAWYAIHECHYYQDGTLYACTTEPVDVSGESIQELRQTLEWMLSCLDKPVVKWTDIPSPKEEE
jgi:hypothetical protein